MMAVDDKKRQVVKENWFQDLRRLQLKVHAKFFNGTQRLSEDDLTKLSAEQHEHHDITFLTNLVDQYFNLNRKTLHSLIWIAEVVNAQYMMKTDDDIYILSGSSRRA